MDNNKRLVLLVLIIQTIIGLIAVDALPDFNLFREGSCAGVPHVPAPVSTAFIESCKYFSSGNKYHMYKMAAGMPNYPTMREDEYYYGFCPSHNVTLSDQIGAAFGFGRILGTFRVTVPPGYTLEATPTIPELAWDTLRQTVTLTDHKSFVFLVNCWTGVDERGWNVGQLTSKRLDNKTLQMIEDHAVSLGFKREHFVFLRYDSCSRADFANPYLDYNEWDDSSEKDLRRMHFTTPISPVPGRLDRSKGKFKN